MNANGIETELGPQPNSPNRPTGAAPACPAAGYQPIDTHNALSGRDLRYVLTDYISRGYRTVAQLVNMLAEDGYTVWGRASKVISDALRWEIRNGRVRRLKRGVYTIGTIPRSTRHRIATRTRDLFLAPHVVATRRDTNQNRARIPHPPADRFWRAWMKSQPRSRVGSMRWTDPGAAAVLSP